VNNLLKKLSKTIYMLFIISVFYAGFAAQNATSAPLGKNIQVGDISMYVEDHGKGDPIIFLHGGLGSANAWGYQVPVFSKNYRVITPDSRGQARSTDSALPLTYHVMAEDIVRLMDVLKIPSAYIVGWSDGGNIGIDLAINHSNRVKAVVAYGANINPAGLQKHFLDYLRTATPKQIEKDNGSEFLELSAHPENLPVIAQKIKNMWINEPNFTAAQLAKITVPTLIMDGQQEELIRPDHAKEIAAAIPSAKLVMLPNVGHYALFKTPEQWNDAVMSFIKAH
jgi:pimeloyl-ACP methyl ester carboxylesterase